MSVRKVANDKQIKCVLYSRFCIFQDLKTNVVIAMGKLEGNLYVLESNSFDQKVIQEFCKYVSVMTSFACMNNCIDDISNVSIWYKCLGHPSNLVLKHVYVLKGQESNVESCDVCPLAKQTCLPFPTSVSSTFAKKAKFCLQLRL